MNLETIEKNGQTFALIPIQTLDALLADSEMLHDIEMLNAAKARIESGEDEIIPFELIERRVAGESPLKIWREYRNMTQEKLAQVSKVSRAMIAAIESGHKTGSIATLKSLAAALNVDLDNIAA